MLPGFNSKIIQILERVASRPSSVNSYPRNKPKASGGNLNRRPFYYDAEDIQDKEVPLKLGGGILNKIDQMHAATTGKGSISDLIDIAKTPTIDFAKAARGPMFIRHTIDRKFKLARPAQKTRPTLFFDKKRSIAGNADEEYYYEINPSDMSVREYYTKNNTWGPVTDTEATMRVVNAWKFIKNPKRQKVDRNLPPV